MPTGSINYSPDYKSKSQVKRIAAQKGVCSMCGENHAEATARDNAARAVAAERSRLEREVIEAAKAELAAHRAPGTFGWLSNRHRAQRILRSAVSALIDFESSQEK